MGEYITIKAETERVYYNFRRSREWLYSAGLRYSPYNRIGVECNVIFQRGEIPNRTFRIEYTSQF
jgi:hypothetical protein